MAKDRDDDSVRFNAILIGSRQILKRPPSTLTPHSLFSAISTRDELVTLNGPPLPPAAVEKKIVIIVKMFLIIITRLFRGSALFLIDDEFACGRLLFRLMRGAMRVLPD